MRRSAPRGCDLEARPPKLGSPVGVWAPLGPPFEGFGLSAVRTLDAAPSAGLSEPTT
jgi:hypothetical protein